MFTHSTPAPTEADFNYEHPKPLKAIEPSLPLDQIYHLIMKEKLWKSWSGDSFGIAYAGDQRPFEIDVKGSALSLRDRMVLRNKEGQTLAVCLGMFLKWETTFKIYGLTPYMEGQEASSQQHEGQKLYEWAEAKDKMLSVRKVMKCVDGVQYVMDGVGKIFAKRQMRISRDGKPCAHCREVNLGIFTGNQWDIRIGVGIDPCLIIAFMVIMDEMDEQ